MTEYLTPKGLQEIKDKLEHLKNVKRPEIAERINSAKELGDLSENAEYSSAKEDQGMLEAEIQRLENILKTAVVVKTIKNNNIVAPGACVVLEIDGEKKEVCLVDPESVSPANGKISLHSPIGQAILDQMVGKTVILKVPSGNKKIKIIEIKPEK